MSYNFELNEKILTIVEQWHKNTGSKKMFGGTCHLVNGNMFCGVYKDYLILRLGPEQVQTALEQPHTRVFDITGKPMKGWVMVAEEGFAGDNKLEAWLQLALAFAESLPPK